MKKILSGILGLFLVVGLVAGAGYALFSSKVTMNGMVLGTATPSLLLSYDDKSYRDEFTLPTQSLFAPLLPGEMDWGEFYLQNASNGTTDKLDFNLKGRITAAGGDWNFLKDAVKLKVCLYKASTGYNCDDSNTTGWKTLSQWNAEEITLPGNPLTQNEISHFTMVFYIDPSYTNTIAGKTITGMNMEITGTQVQ